MSGDGQAQPQPRTRVLVLGDTPIARGVLALGGALGYEVTAFDPSALDGVAGVVLASHGGPDEDGALRASLRAGVPYIGLVAGRARGEAVMAALGVDGEALACIHTPAGLDIGPATPEEIALAILAEMVSVRPRVPGQARAARGKRTCSH